MKKNIFNIILTVALCFISVFPVSAVCSSEESNGADFLDQLTFFGESTTTHLRQRSCIDNSRVWANASGTAKLDSNLANRPLFDLKSNDHMTPTELAQRDQPDFLVLSFGLNGIMDFYEHPDDYLKKYQKLIDALSEASPNTFFLIQSIYPVAREEFHTDWRFSASPEEINKKIQVLNQHLETLAKSLSNADFIDTSCNLKDEEGFLQPEYTTDGIHLTEDAYATILARLELYGKQRH